MTSKGLHRRHEGDPPEPHERGGPGTGTVANTWQNFAESAPSKSRSNEYSFRHFYSEVLRSVKTPVFKKKKKILSSEYASFCIIFKYLTSKIIKWFLDKLNRISIWPSHSTPRYIPQRTENRSSSRHLHTNVQSSPIPISQRVATTQMSSNRWMRQKVVYPYNGISLGLARNEVLTQAATTAEPWKHYTKWKNKIWEATDCMTTLMGCGTTFLRVPIQPTVTAKSVIICL